MVQNFKEKNSKYFEQKSSGAYSEYIFYIERSAEWMKKSPEMQRLFVLMNINWNHLTNKNTLLATLIDCNIREWGKDVFDVLRNMYVWQIIQKMSNHRKCKTYGNQQMYEISVEHRQLILYNAITFCITSIVKWAEHLFGLIFLGVSRLWFLFQPTEEIIIDIGQLSLWKEIGSHRSAIT